MRVEQLEDRRLLSASPRLLKDINPPPESVGSDPKLITEAAGKVFFVATDNLAGQELWVTDGTTSGAKLVKDIHLGAADANPYALTSAGNLLYFAADDGVAGAGLYRSDGTEAGTLRLADIPPSGFGPAQIAIAEFDGVAYFAPTGASAATNCGAPTARRRELNW